ncbi:MAG TPA: PBP1A family penicillin-binding protein, partial [Vicinamibacterales bacterium]
SKPPVRSRSAAVPARTRRRRRGRWLAYAAALLGGPLLLLAAILSYYYVTLSRVIETRLHGEKSRAYPRIFARPLELHTGQGLTDRELIDRLNDLGYAHRPRVEEPGQFAIGRNTVVFAVRGGEHDGRVIRVTFGPASARPGSPATNTIKKLEAVSGPRLSRVTLEPPLLTALIPEARAKRRKVPLSQIPARVQQAVLAIEDRRFYDHPGVDVIRSAGAVLTNLRGDKPYLVGGSTLTQQLVKNLLLTPEKTMTRKLKEQFMAIIAEQRLTKDEIFELYLNEVYLGQRGSFAIHGLAEAARLYFGKDVVNLTLAEAATLAGMIQSPQIYSPFRNPDRCVERRNVVLQAMHEAGYITADAAVRASQEPLRPVARALESEAPYFVDFVEQHLASASIDLRRSTADVYTTLDLHLQRLAQDAVRTGLQKVDQILSKRRRRTGPAQAALIAVNPRTGDILAFVGGRSYNQSQFNRAASARRQPGSVFKPFVYLAAFEQALAEGRADLTPATVVTDEPTTFFYEDKDYAPGNYDNEYDGPITLRRALARSRNIAAVKVAEAVGYEHVAELWRKIGIGTPPQPYPSIALGVFEATPLEIATAYTVFANDGEVRPLRAVTRLELDGRRVEPPALGKARRVASVETTYLVTNMMRSVVDEGTGAAARAAGFRLEAAGKSGTTNDLRDAWFVGFTPELLTVVWVGLDDNRPLGMSGTQAALPIWTSFMNRALAGHASRAFEVPEGITFAEIDPDTGGLATPGCPKVLNEAFLPGTAPAVSCPLHVLY